MVLVIIGLISRVGVRPDRIWVVPVGFDVHGHFLDAFVYGVGVGDANKAVIVSGAIGVCLPCEYANGTHPEKIFNGVDRDIKFLNAVVVDAFEISAPEPGSEHQSLVGERVKGVAEYEKQSKHIADSKPKRHQVQKEEWSREPKLQTTPFAHVADKAKVVKRTPAQTKDEEWNSGKKKWYGRWATCPNDPLIPVEHAFKLGW